MPTLDRLAANGLTYSQWHTTSVCSPTRSTFLTGRNHHQNGFGTINGASGEGSPSGSVNENRFFNGYPDELEANLALIDKLGSPDISASRKSITRPSVGNRSPQILE